MHASISKLFVKVLIASVCSHSAWGHVHAKGQLIAELLHRSGNVWAPLAAGTVLGSGRLLVHALQHIECAQTDGGPLRAP